MTDYETVEQNGRTLVRCPYSHGDTPYPVAFPSAEDLLAHFDQEHSWYGRRER